MRLFLCRFPTILRGAAILRSALRGDVHRRNCERDHPHCHYHGR